VLMIGLALVKVGVQYAAGGVPLIGKPEYGSLAMWIPALVVILVTLGPEVLHARHRCRSRRCLSASSPATSWP
jgi:xanthine/uracil permease